MFIEVWGSNYNIPGLVQTMAWRRSGDKPWSEPVMISLLTYICVTRPQWVNVGIYHVFASGAVVGGATTLEWYAFSLSKVKYDNRIGEYPWRSWKYLICIITHGLCSYNARLFNDGVTAIGVSYWWRRKFPNYARLHRGRISHCSFLGFVFIFTM